VRVRFVVVLGALMCGLGGCAANTPCDATTCPGCCAADGTCQSGDQNQACGFAGAACATCTGITTCGAQRVCGTPVCRPQSCASLGRSCGEVSDGCGGVLRCGTCSGSDVCTAFTNTGAELWQCGKVCQPACAGGTACSPKGVCTADLSTLRFDETVKSISAKLRLNGVDAVKGASPSCNGSSNPTDLVARIRWTDAAQQLSGRHDILCGAVDLAFTLRLAPGRYTIAIDPGPAAERVGLGLPSGGWKAAAPLVVSATGAQADPKPFFDVTGFATVQGRLRLNGAAPVQNPFCTDVANASAEVALVEFVNRDTSATAGAAITCTSPNFGFSARLVPGHYDVRIRPGAQAAAAGLALPDLAVLVREKQTLAELAANANFEVQTITVSGTVTVAGAPVTIGNYCNPAPRANDELARVRFVDRQKGHEISRPILCDPTLAWSFVLPAGGTWDVLVSPGQMAAAAGANLLPMEVQVRDALWLPSSAGPFALDQRFSRLTGTVTLKGLAPPTKNANFCNLAPNTDLAVLRLRDTQRAHHAEFYFKCSSPNWDVAIDLPEGIWVASIERASPLSAAATNLPEGSYSFPFGIQILGPTGTIVDLPVDSHDVGVQVRVNGKIPELPLTCQSAPNTVFAQLELTQVSTGLTTLRPLDCNHVTAWKVTVPLAPGAWTLRMRADDPEAPLGGLLPGWFSLAEPMTVPLATGNVQLDQLPVTLTGTVTVNGEPPVRLTGGAGECGFTGPAAFVTVSNTSGTYSGTARVDCTTSATPQWKVSVPAHGGDTYRVQLQGADQSVPFNLLRELVPVVQNLDVPKP
jgi:hypothetical protein